MRRQKLPNTDSVEELAKFWDTHDLTDFAYEPEEVEGPVFARQSTSAVTVPLSAEERMAIRRIAASRGLDEAALIHAWVQEKLHH